MKGAQISLPAAFRAPRFVQTTNIGLAAMTMAAAACVVLGDVRNVVTPEQDRGTGTICALVTLLFGVAWIKVMHRFSGFAAVAWSFVLAAVASGIAVPLTDRIAPASDGILPAAAAWLGQMILGATAGGTIWLPALAACWVVFGLPLRYTERAAARGLSDGELGELVSTSSALLLAILVLGVLPVIDLATSARPHDIVTRDRHVAFGLCVLAVAGAVTNFAVIAYRRYRRRRFLADVREGRQNAFRIERKRSGPEALFRVQMSTANYRIAPASDEELLELDPRGDALRAVG